MLNLRKRLPMGLSSLVLAAGFYFGIGTPGLIAQDKPQTTPSQQDNPFPGDSSQTAPTQSTPGQTAPKQTPPTQPPDQNPAKPATGSDNPFPGEDPNAPIIPVAPSPAGSGSGRPDYSSSGSSAAAGDPNSDGDPVRSPDPQGNSVNNGFSSSQAGLKPLGDEAVTDAKPGSSKKVKTRDQVLKEDVDIGTFYLGSKNWRGAESRFEDAYGLDPENEDAVWGLAEAERHLQLFDKAAAHYKLFLSYDPDGPHSRAARKALEEVQAAKPSTTQSGMLPK